jgi:hypothetical protein
MHRKVMRRYVTSEKTPPATMWKLALVLAGQKVSGSLQATRILDGCALVLCDWWQAYIATFGKVYGSWACERLP